MRREVVDRELLDALPTGRDFQTIGNVLPGVTMGRFDVGGSSTAQSGTLVAFGSRGADFQLKIDGMHANNSFGEGWFNGIYHNEAAFQEMSYTVSGGSAENQAAGVSVNMIPRTGGNTYTYEFLGTFANNSLQGENIDDALRAQGIQPDRRRPADSCGTSTATRAGRSTATACGSSGRPGTGASPKTSPTSTGVRSDPRVVPPGAEQASDPTDAEIRTTGASRRSWGALA